MPSYTTRVTLVSPPVGNVLVPNGLRTVTYQTNAGDAAVIRAVGDGIYVPISGLFDGGMDF